MGTTAKPTVPPTTTPPAPKPLWQSKTFWGVVVVALMPVATKILEGNVQPGDIGNALGVILAGAGFRDQAGRIESYIAALVAGAQGK